MDEIDQANDRAEIETDRQVAATPAAATLPNAKADIPPPNRPPIS